MRELLVIDGFLESFDALQDYAATAVFADIPNPIDGVVYPHICADIPSYAREEVLARIADYLGRAPEGVTLFMRQSPKGVHVPHAVHSDMSMGRHSLMLYLNKRADCQGGTSFLCHRATGIGYNPDLQSFSDIVVADQNNSKAWRVCDLVEMAPNRAVIFDSSRLHRAEPSGGFGIPGAGARVVLTCFFS